MSEIAYQEALEAYSNPFHEFEVNPLDAGLINKSYRVTSKSSGESFLLQQINKQVFPDPLAVQENYISLWQYNEFEFTGFRMPAPMYFPKDMAVFCDSNHNYWRVFEFIEGCYSPQTVGTSAQAKATAKLFGRFTASLEDFNSELLKVVIPGFHDLSLRYQQFLDSLKNSFAARQETAKTVITELKARERYCHFYDVITSSDQFPKRVMHHDAKPSNVLFQSGTNKVVCPVDFDTAMPGFYFSDLGDLIRSMVAKFDENHRKAHEISIRKSFYQAIIDGYMMVMKDHLTSSEIKYIHFAGIAIVYMQSLRFMADYLNGDTYYKISYSEHNFDRAFNQLFLLQKLEEFLAREYKFRI